MSRDSEEYLNLLKMGHLAVLPSLYEPFGISAVECMYYSTPVIAPNNWAFPEIIASNYNGILLDKDFYRTSLLDEAIEHYLSSPDDILTQGRQAFESVSNKYSWSIVADKLVNYNFS
jgi:glycosyltransferase involved in cell wall biosynthesis